MRHAKFLVVDLGNTAAKLRLAAEGALIGKTRRVPTETLLSPAGPSALRAALGGWTYDRVVLASVVPAAARAVAEATSHATLLQVSAQCDTGVDLHGYRGRHSLGQDRIASAAGALARHGPGPLIVVDFGTAATFNVLDASGRFLGGVIAPGLAAVRDYLPERTAQLPPLNLRRRLSAATGGDTRASMLAGVTLGYRGLVREIVTGIRAELETPARVIATGGDARWVAGQLPGTFDVIDPDLTLHGLRTIATRHRWP